MRDVYSTVHNLPLEPWNRMRFETTATYQTCTRINNVCQTCLLDLEYELPTQVRDTALVLQNETPTNDVNRDRYAQNMEGNLLHSSWRLIDRGWIQRG